MSIMQHYKEKVKYLMPPLFQLYADEFHLPDYLIWFVDRIL